MAEFKLGRIKFVYKSGWTTGTSYVVDDVVTVGGKTYICVLSHSSAALFNTDLSANPPKWNIMADGLSWRADWAASTYYNKGDLAKYGGIVYQCNTPHTSATNVSPTYLGLEQDQAKWDAFATSFYWSGAWAINTKYRINDFVSYGGITYVCKTAHISAANTTLGLEQDQAKWDSFNSGVTYLGAWSASSVRYKLNDVVKYGADLWICTTQHTSSATFDIAKFQVFVNGLQFEDSWSQSTTYQIGDVVTYGGYSYVASQNHINQIPSTATSYWSVYTTGFNFQGDWLVGTSYKVGQVVRLGGYTYVCTADNVGNTPPNVSYWARLNQGLRWNSATATYTSLSATNILSSGTSAVFTVVRQGTVYTATATTPGSGYAISDTLKILGTSVGGLSPVNDVTLTVTGVTTGGVTTVTASGSSTTWSTGVTYVLGDVVYWGASSYICVSAHVAGSPSRPDNDTTATYWNLLANGTDVAVLTTKGDTFYYGANGATRLPVGTDGQVLRVSSQGYPAWAYYGQINNLVWVAPSGVDTLDNGQGTTIDKPWRSVRYAANKVEEGYLNRQAKQLLDINKQFLIKEIDSYVAYTFRASVTGTSAGAFTTASTAGLYANMPVNITPLTGSLTLAGSAITATTTYYVKTIVANTSFTVSATQTNGVAGSAVTAAGTGTATAAYVYYPAKTQRDAGYTVDGIAFDISHSGTSKTVANALAYYTTAGTAYVSGVYSYDITAFTSALAYMKTLVDNVLTQTAPATSYQTLMSVATPAVQLTDVTLVAETGTSQTAQDLITIIRTGLLAGNTTGIPTAIQPTTTIRVTTGTFDEVLPINLPSYCAVVGDELRTTVIQPASANKYLVNDKSRSVNALRRLQAIVPTLMSNGTVTPTTGNAVAQVTSLPAGSVGSTLAVSRAVKSAQTIYDVFTNGIASLPTFEIPDPTGYGSSLTDTAYSTTGNLTGATTGYDLGRAQIIQNIAFLKADVSQYLINNYSSVWTTLGATGQAKCQRDVGYIIDALVYDITYGGNTQALVAGSSYFSYYQLTIAGYEKDATIAAYAYLKTQVAAVVLKNAVKASGNATDPVTTGTAGSTAASNFAADRIQTIVDWITNGTASATKEIATSWVASAVVAANTALQARRSEIASDSSLWVKKFFQSLNFVEATCQRDIGLMVDAIGRDIMTGSNYAAIVCGMSYYRGTSSAAVVVANQFAAQQGVLTFLRDKVKTIAAAGSAAQAVSNIDDLIGYIYNGAVPYIQAPDQSTTTAAYAAAKNSLTANKAFLQAEVIAYIAANYSSVVYDANICKRDVGMIIDAVRYDMTYGGTFASVQAGKAYYSALTSAFQIAGTEKAATLAAYGYLSTLMQSVAQNTAVASPLQGSVTQVRNKGTQTVGSAGAATQIGALMTIITNIINNGTTSGVQTLTVTTIATLNTLTSNGHGLAVGDILIPQASSNGLTAGVQYYVQSFTTNTFTLSTSYLGAAIGTLTNGTGLTLVFEKIVMATLSGVSNDLTSQYVTLSAARTTLRTAVISFITTNYPLLSYDQATCSRDVGYIVDAICLDFCLNSNFRSIKAGKSYYQAQAAVVIAGQKQATIDAMNYLKTQISSTLYASATAQARANRLMDIIVNILTKGVGDAASTEYTPEVHGTITYENTLTMIRGSEILRANSNFIAAELSAYTTLTYSAPVTNTTGSTNVITTTSAHKLIVGDPVQFSAATITTIATAATASNDQFTVNSTAGFVANMPVSFTGTAFGNVTPSTVYYVKTIVDGTKFTISDTSGGTVRDIPTNQTGSMTVTVGGLFGGLVANTVYFVATTPSTTTFTITNASTGNTQTLTTASGIATSTYYFNDAKCKRDTAEYVKALVYDLQYTGTYRTLNAGMLYNNSVAGSALQDMFRVRNATGLRNCTLSGLNGVLTNANAYGTRRPTAGAFVALDPGFGPNDTNVWVNTRSHYSQNVTMFGTGCSGAKIDASLHGGGNKSMVKNDFTTIISDGIGVWLYGSGSLTELVSVFNYYGYAGYLAEFGGRIRATNGNSSYGTYGVIAEGVDTYETPLYGTINNRYFQAQITNTVTDFTNKILRFEFGNAGTNYTNTTHSISGSGYNATAVADEFRDGALFETRIIDLNDGNGYGGSSYASFANAAQSGDRTSITIAATDTSLTNAYAGMRIQITAGTGVGQYGNVLTYQNGSKVARIWKDSFTPLTITATTNGTPSSVTVANTETLYVNMPFYVATTVGGLTVDTLYYVKAILSGTTFSVTDTSGGTAFTSQITTTTGQSVTLYCAGWDHAVPGTTIPAALDLTTTYVIEPRLSHTAPGYANTARTMPTIAASVSVAATGTSGQNTISVAASSNIAIGQAVSGTNIGTGAYVTNIAGAGPYTITLSVNNSGAVASSITFTGNWAAAAYGAGNYVAVGTGSTAIAYSADGKSWTQVAAALPAPHNWRDVIYIGGEGATATATVGGFGGSGAVLTAVLGVAGSAVAGADQVASVTVVNGGTGYTTAPTIVFTAAAGSGAVGTAVVLNGAIVSVSIVIPGSGYTATPTVSAAIDRVTAITPTQWGKNYYGSVTVNITDPFSGNAWASSGASGALNTIIYYNNSGIKNWYKVTTTGTFTLTGPTHTSGSASNGTAVLLYIGTTAVGSAVITNYGVSGVTVTNTGLGYTAVPTVTFTDSSSRFLAISRSTINTAYVAPSNIGGAWSGGGSLGSSLVAGIAYGAGTVVVVGGTNYAATSTDGAVTGFVARAIGTTSGTWVAVAYGAGTFVAISSNGASNTSANGVSWAAQGTLPGSVTNWVDMCYGEGKFVAISGGSTASRNIAYSIDNGVTWLTSGAGLPSSQLWNRVRYSQGVFIATADNYNAVAFSYDGITWVSKTVSATSNWAGIAFGNTNKNPLWVVTSRTSGTLANTLRTGAQATSRAKVTSAAVTEVRMIEPGSGYAKGAVSATTVTTNLITVDNTELMYDGQPVEFVGCAAAGLAENVTYYVIGSTITSTQFKVGSLATPATPVTLSTQTLTGTYRTAPILTQFDPNKVKTAAFRQRMGDGALANPGFPNRGTNNTTATATTLGDGFSDLYQPSTFVNVGGLYDIPKPGANVEFANIPSTWFKLVAVTNILGTPGNYTAQFQINPSLSVYNAPAQGTLITTRLKYSQVRLTGHDFLYIGTGNKTRTNYPYVDTTLAVTANQANFSGGGRVFFTSTDQDGNFNVGNLFGVQQATGTATLNASAFNLSGLQSLQLGAVSIGVGSAVITQFSTDPYFTANSDSIVPTQRAIKAYITAQIGGGASSLNVNTLTAGVVYLANNTISTTTGVQINVTSKMNFTGGVDGAPVALGFFLQR